MAHMLMEGKEGVAKYYNGVFALVEEGACFGCHHCQGVMAYCNMFGHGYVRNGARSLELARESSRKGSRYGQFTLGYLHEFGGRHIEHDEDQSVALYRLAASQNLDKAQWRLGYMYFHGLGVARDHAEAIGLFQLAASQGHPCALCSVADCHEHGLGGVCEDKAEAIRWFRRVQAAGDTCAADDLRRLRACEPPSPTIKTHSDCASVHCVSCRNFCIY